MDNTAIAKNLERYYDLAINAKAPWEFFNGLANYAGFILETPQLKSIVDTEMEKRARMYHEVDELEKQAVSDLSAAKQKLLDVIKRYNLDVHLFKQYASLIPMAHENETVFDHLKLFEEGKISISGTYSNNLEHYIFDIAANLLRLGYGDHIKEFIVSGEDYAKYFKKENDESDLQLTGNLYGNFIFSKALKLREHQEEAIKRSRKLEPWGAFEGLIKLKKMRDAAANNENHGQIIKSCLEDKDYIFNTRDTVDVAFAVEDFRVLMENRNVPERDLHFLRRRDFDPLAATANLYLLQKLPDDSTPGEKAGHTAKTIALQKKKQEAWQASVDSFMDRVEAFMDDYEITKERSDQKDDKEERKWWKDDARPDFDKANGKITLESKECEIGLGTNHYFLCDEVFGAFWGTWVSERTILERFKIEGSDDGRRSCYDAMTAVNNKVEEAFGIKKLLQYKAARVRIRKEIFEHKS
jgi:hypothetical protein